MKVGFLYLDLKKTSNDTYIANQTPNPIVEYDKKLVIYPTSFASSPSKTHINDIKIPVKPIARQTPIPVAPI
jgi:hypothetical protein